MKSEKKIFIIGGGISGIIAALTLEKKGYSPIILESNKQLGGRVQTIAHNGFNLDIGFQVILDAYPLVKKWINFKTIETEKFKPGATIFINGKKHTIGDPSRDLSMLFGTLFSTIGSLSDKRKILKLKKVLKQKTLEEIFNSEEKTTLNYLSEFGFSAHFIAHFFKPFFTGIFLESNLSTSSRKFEFVFKMFSEGSAILPKNGIQEITNQLTAQLKTSQVKLNTTVTQVQEGTVITENGETLSADAIIIATEPSHVVANLKNQQLNWKSCENLYFTIETKTIPSTLIGLIPEPSALINNISILPKTGTNSNHVLSVTIVQQHQLPEPALIKQIEQELLTHCNIKTMSFIKRFQIKQALPLLNDLRYDLEPSETQLMRTVFLAGDHLLNGSLNAAMMSGEKAAFGVTEVLEGNFGL